MYQSEGRSIYTISDWLYAHVAIYSVELDRGSATLYLPVLVIIFMVLVTWVLLSKTGFDHQIYSFGSNPDPARRSGINVALIQNGLNLLGISPFAFKMIGGAIIRVAITTTNLERISPQSRTSQKGSTPND